MGTNNERKMQIHVNQSSEAFLLLILITLAGFGMVIWGFRDISRVNDFREHAVETVGTVVDYDISEDEDDDDIYYARYEYTVNGDTYTVRDDDYDYFAPDLGDTEVIYYDPRQPNEAATHLGGGSGPVLVATGLIFGLVGLAFILARFGVDEAVIKILLGVMLVIIGFVLPIAAHAWLMLLFTGIFGVCGVIIIVKTITKLTGNEGGAVDQAIDAKVNAAGEVVMDIAAAQQNGEFGGGALSEVDISPILYVPHIIKGIAMFVPSAIFLVVGGSFISIGIRLSEVMAVAMGGISFAVGVGIVIKGIMSIKEGLDIRKAHRGSR